jgi:hypothetical protein
MEIKRQLKYDISEHFATISHFNNGNEVVINRYVNLWGITLENLVDDANELISTYNRKFGKRYGYISYWVVSGNKAYKNVENNLVEIK